METQLEVVEERRLTLILVPVVEPLVDGVVTLPMTVTVKVQHGVDLLLLAVVIVVVATRVEVFGALLVELLLVMEADEDLESQSSAVDVVSTPTALAPFDIPSAPDAEEFEAGQDVVPVGRPYPLGGGLNGLCGFRTLSMKYNDPLETINSLALSQALLTK